MHNWGPPNPDWDDWQEIATDDFDDAELAWAAVRLGFIFFLISSSIQAAGVFAILRILSNSEVLSTTLSWTSCYLVVLIFNLIRLFDRFTHRAR